MEPISSADEITNVLAELIAVTPAIVTSTTQLGVNMSEFIYQSNKQLRKLRQPDNIEAWENEIANYLQAQNNVLLVRNLTYCVLFALNTKEMEPLLRSANSTFANVLLRECCKDNSLTELQVFLPMLYRNFEENRVPNIEKAIAKIIQFTAKMEVTEQQIHVLNLPMLSKAPFGEKIELPARILLKIKLQEAVTELIKSMQPVEKKKESAVTRFFSRRPSVDDGMAHQRNILMACIDYLKSQKDEDKQKFLQLYTQQALPETFRKTLDDFFKLEEITEKQKLKSISVRQNP